MYAVILAAGDGGRMGLDMPKAMLMVDDENLINRQIRQCGECGLESIVVLGYQSGRVLESLSVMPSVILQNNHWNITETAYSVDCARHFLTSPFIIINGDVLFTTNTLQELKNEEFNALVVVECEKGDKEAWQLDEFGGLSRGGGSGIEYLGLSKVEAVKDYHAIYSTRRFSYYDEILNVMSRSGNYFGLVDGEGMEIDTLEDYKRGDEWLRVYESMERGK